MGVVECGLMAEPSNSQPEAAANGPLRPPVRVALVTAGGPAPPPLLEALADRGVDLERARSVFDAMAIVTRASARLRSRDDRAGDEANDPAAPIALLLVEPEAIPRAAELVAAVKRYAPGVVIWRYEAAAAIPLRGYEGGAAGRLAEARPRDADGSDEATAATPPADGAPPAIVTKRARPLSHADASGASDDADLPARSGQPRLRLTDPMDDADEPDIEASPRAGDEPALDAAERARPGEEALLTPEELAMLLGEPDETDAPRGST